MKTKVPSKLALTAGFGIIYVVWGTTYLAIRLAIETIPPLSMVGSRFLIAGLLLYAWGLIHRHPRPSTRDLKHSAITGLLLIFLANGTVTWTEQFLPSGLVALIVASIPTWISVLG